MCTHVNLDCEPFDLTRREGIGEGDDEVGNAIDHDIRRAGRGPYDCKPQGPDVDVYLDGTVPEAHVDDDERGDEDEYSESRNQEDSHEPRKLHET